MFTIYQINTIHREELLKDCPKFEIDQYRWSKDYKPRAFGQMAFLDKEGFIISMTAAEKNPLRIYTQDDDPVYKDSALEVFLDMKPEQKKGYFYFEMNANGALLSGFEDYNKQRIRLKEITQIHACCNAGINNDSWSALLKIPMDLICDVYKTDKLEKGAVINCNFYKISEDPKIEHYASHFPIDWPTPNFHLPEFFGKAVIC